MKEFIQNLIDNQLKLYRSTPNRMVADYNSELQHVNDYNGRQLLELIQNADDEKADTIAITLDTTNNTLTLSNTGTPFSESGYESLMLSNLSSKTKEQFIGNKGLGFRSIINWSEEIVIKSNGIDVIFSERIAKNNFEITFPDEIRSKIRTERDLSDTAIPWAILSTPEVVEGKVSEWATEIVIRYRKNYLTDIKKQLGTLQKEVLLFLNNLHEMRIDSDGDAKQITKIKNDDNITINGEIWSLKDTGSIALPSDLQDKSKGSIQHYNIKLCLPDVLEFIENPLFSYFPTKILLDFPFLIHGTFDLDSSRNQLNDTDKNRYVLERLVEHIVNTAKDRTKDNVCWNPVRILTYNNKNPVLDDLDFYDLIDNARETMEIFPCIDNTYRTIDQVVFLSNTFSSLLSKTNGETIFPNMLLPLDNDLKDIYELDFNYEIENLVEKVNDYSVLLTQFSIDNRAKLINELLNWGKGNLFSILVNNNNKVINTDDEEAFTPLTRGTNNIDLPSHVKIEFINNSLFERFTNSITIGSENKARVVQRKLKGITRIQAYEPAELISKIITSTNRVIKRSPENKNDYIVEMVTSLFLIYLDLGEDIASPRTSNITLLNTRKALVKASDLYLGKGYISGNYVNEIFSIVYGEEAFVAEKEIYGLESEDGLTVDKFFYWLGVNKYVKTKRIENDYRYERYLRTKNKIPSDHRSSRLKALAISQELLDKTIDKLSFDKILLWILKDNVIKTRILELNIDEAHYCIKGEYYGSFSHSYYTVPSYILFQLRSYEIFDSHLITDDKSISFVNTYNPDYKYFEEREITKIEVDSILLKLGAKDKFEELSIEQINNIVKSLPEHDKKGKQTQKLYKLSLDHFRKNKLSLDNDIELFALKGKETGYFKQSEIYYSDNIKLPGKITNNIPLLNLPKRSGGKQVIEFFRINNLNDIQLDVVSHAPLEKISTELSRKLVKLNPYILAHRIFSIQNIKQKNIEAKSLSKLNITLCDDIRCSYNEIEFNLNDYDYVFDGKSYLIKTTQHGSIKKIIHDSSFSDSFSEIICTVFKVNENKAEFRNILRNDPEDTKHIIVNELGHEVLFEAKELLGISDYYVSFWNSILKTRNIKCDREINPDNLGTIAETLNIDISEITNIDYSTIESDNPSVFVGILNKLSVTISEFNINAFYKISLAKMHERNINNTLMQYHKKFKNLLWHKLLNSSTLDKSKFIKLLTQYDHQDDWVSTQSTKLKEVTDIDCKDLVIRHIDDTFNISMDSTITDDVAQPDMAYQNNMLQMKITNDADFPEEILSYLYFDDCLNRVQEHINKDNDQPEGGAIDENQEPVDLPDSPSDVKPPDQPPKSRKPKKGKKHSSKHDQEKKKKGLESEVIVYRALVKKYGEQNVVHASKNDDTLGYDIRYSPDNGQSWKYVEVKSFSNSYFYLTKNEKEFAENNLGEYEVYLVDQDKEISILLDVDYRNEEQFLLDINDYIVYCELQ